VKSLPACEPETGFGRRRTAVERPLATENVNITSPTLLISDDDPDVRESLAEVFSEQGFETVLVGDGRAALDVVCCRDVHLVLIDFHMPRLTGIEALRLIKQRKEKLPVILMSAEMTEELAKQVLDERAWAVHRKPVDIRKIQADVLDALKKTWHWPLAG
jgi:DNA-binding NtrC family response regulator